MRRLLLATSCFLSLAGLVQAQVVNGDFESYDPATHLPTGWQRNLSSGSILFGAYATPPSIFYYGQTLQNAIPLSGSASLFATQTNTSYGAVWQTLTLPTAPLASATLTLNYAARLGGSTATDVAQIALASPSALASNPAAASVVLFSVNAAGGPVTVPLQTLTLTATGQTLLALRGQPTALAFYVYGYSFPAQLIIDDVSLSWVVARMGSTPNQLAAYNALASTTAPVLGDLVTTLVGMGQGQQDTVLQHLGAPIYGDTMVAALGDARQFGGAIADQLYQRRQPGIAGGPQATTRALGDYTVWGQAYGGAFHQGATGNTGLTGSGGGFAAGFDRQVDPSLRLGFAVGGATLRTSATGTGAFADGATAHAGPYLSYTRGPWFLDAQAFGTWHGATVKREMGSGLGRATGESTGLGASGALEMGRQFAFRGFALEPFLGLRADRINRDGMTEKGSALAQQVAGAGTTSARSTIGLRVAREVPVAGRAVTLTARAAWAHEVGETVVRTDAAFLAGGEGFRVASARAGREAAVLGAGAALPVARGVSVYARYNAELRSTYTAQSGTAGLRWTF